MRICGLSTENQRSPLNIGCKRPVFGWRAEGEEEGIRQEAYRIQVWREEGRAVDTVWDSGWVASSRMTSIAYEGELQRQLRADELKEKMRQIMNMNGEENAKGRHRRKGKSKTKDGKETAE